MHLYALPMCQCFNPLTPRGDLHVTSPYNIHTLFTNG